MIKMHEIKNMTLSEIQQQLSDTEEELANLKLQLATHQLDDSSRVTHTRRDVARLKTVLHEIETGARKPIDQQEREGA